MPTDAPEGLDYFFKSKDDSLMKAQGLAEAEKLRRQGWKQVTKKQWEKAFDGKAGVTRQLPDKI